MTTYEIDIQNEYGISDFPTQRVTDAIHFVLDHHQIEDGAGLALVVTTDNYVQSLNVQYRGVDAPTDVLSFPAAPLPDEIEGEPLYLGDLIIAYPYTVHQAQEAGHDLSDELVLLAVHGTLHLLGYDHDDADNEQAMWAEQAEALAAMGVTIDVPRFTFGDASE